MYSLDSAAYVPFTADFQVSAEGSHTLSYYATDQAGNQGAVRASDFRLDVTAPSAAIDLLGDTTAGAWFRSDVTVNLSAQDAASGVSSISFRVDGGPQLPYDGPFPVTEEGTHTLAVSAVDLAGNEGTWLNHSFGIDRQAPVTVCSLSGVAGDNGWYRSSVVATLTATDTKSGVALLEVRIDNDSWSVYAGSLLVSAPGSHVLQYRATDSAGNVEDERSIPILVDIEAPVSSVELSGTAGEGEWFTSDVTVTISAIDNGSGLASTLWSLDGMIWQDVAGPLVINAEGIHSLSFRSLDVAGNAEDVRMLSVAIDLSRPTATLTANGNSTGDWYLSPVTVCISAEDSASGIWSILYSVDAGPFQNYTSPFNLSAEGTYRVAFYAVDQAGSIGGQNVTEVRIDLSPPAASVDVAGDAGMAGWWLSDVTVTIIANDTISGVESTLYRIDEALWQAYEGEFVVNRSGNHIIEYYSTDRAGHAGLVQSSTIAIDLSKPTVSKELNGSQGMDGWYVGPVGLSLTASDRDSGVSSLNYSLDGGPTLIYAGPFTVNGDGMHHIVVGVRDRAGNEGTILAIDVAIDTAAPECTAAVEGVAGANGWFVSNVTISLQASDATSGDAILTFSVDGGALMSYGGPIVLTQDGIHIVQYRSQDVAGNVVGPQSLTVRLDQIVPILSFDGSSGRAFTTTGGIISWTVPNERVVGCEISLDGGPFLPVASGSHQFVLSQVSDGNHNLTVRATDPAGNTAVRSTEFLLDTNPLSPTGPNGIWPAVAIVLLISASFVWVALRLRRPFK
jgi:hypothetical protein